MKTQAEADAVIAETVLPPGWKLEARPVRTYKWRSLWALYLFHDGLTTAWAGYDLPGLLRLAAGHARRAEGIDPNAGLRVTTDGQGWVTEIADA